MSSESLKKVRESRARIDGVSRRLARELTSLRAELAEVTSKPRLVSLSAGEAERRRVADEVKAEQRAAREAASARVAAIRAETEAERKAIHKQVHLVLRGGQAWDPVARLNDTIERQAAWERLRPLLDRADDATLATVVEERLRQAEAQGDKATRSALRIELAAYVEARPDPAFAAMAISKMNEVEAEHHPEAREALGVLEEVEKRRGRIETGLALAEADAQGDGPAQIIPGLLPDQDVVLTDEAA
jgi:hypothetical protein